MEEYKRLKTTKPNDEKLRVYHLYEEAADIKLEIEATMKRKITRFTVAGVIILVENSL